MKSPGDALFLLAEADADGRGLPLLKRCQQFELARCLSARDQREHAARNALFGRELMKRGESVPHVAIERSGGTASTSERLQQLTRAAADQFTPHVEHVTIMSSAHDQVVRYGWIRDRGLMRESNAARRDVRTLRRCFTRRVRR
ncbi:MAG TPA: hypothetical protein VNE00_29490 [Paraburkholderia sp.]|nr:hypothetical protein [Paraburkholderia sp.]